MPFCHTFWPPKKLRRKCLIVTNFCFHHPHCVSLVVLVHIQSATSFTSFVTMATNLPSCFSIQFLEQLLKFRVNFTLLKYVKSQRSHGFLITKELIFGFKILDLKDHFSASSRFRLVSFIKKIDFGDEWTLWRAGGWGGVRKERPKQFVKV